MKRAIFIALGAGLVISSAAALDIAGARTPQATAAQGDLVETSRVRDSAREGQRERVHARYAAEREACTQLRGYQREKCVVKAHANKGRALLELAGPYEKRF